MENIKPFFQECVDEVLSEKRDVRFVIRHFPGDTEHLALFIENDCNCIGGHICLSGENIYEVISCAKSFVDKGIGTLNITLS